MIEMGFSSRVAFLAGVFTILGGFMRSWFNAMIYYRPLPSPHPSDNSLVIQSRVIMLDSFVIFLTYLSILCYLKFYHCRNK